MISRFLAQMGWRWVILDMQHGCFNWETAYECIQILRAAGSRPLVRVGIGQTAEAQKALDLGAGGVVAPMVNSRSEAEAMAAAAKYPPLGQRSIGGDFKYTYGPDYPDRANDGTLLLIQLEHIQGVDAADAILGVSGVDGCFIGPTDLALSMGLPRDGFESVPKHRECIQQIVEACSRSCKLVCTNAYTVAEARLRVAEGYSCVTMRSDADLFVDSAQSLLREMEGAQLARAAAILSETRREKVI